MAKKKAATKSPDTTAAEFIRAVLDAQETCAATGRALERAKASAKAAKEAHEEAQAALDAVITDYKTRPLLRGQ